MQVLIAQFPPAPVFEVPVLSLMERNVMITEFMDTYMVASQHHRK